jgi:hypothetical protein
MKQKHSVVRGMKTFSNGIYITTKTSRAAREALDLITKHGVSFCVVKHNNKYVACRWVCGVTERIVRKLNGKVIGGFICLS